MCDDDLQKLIDYNNEVEKRLQLLNKKNVEISAPRRKVGRPSTKPTIKFPDNIGTINKYDNSMIHMILKCRYVNEFKKTILICKYYKCQEINIKFNKNEILFHIPNLDSTLNYFFRIKTEDINLYYCEKEFEIFINLSDFDSALSRTDKDTDIINITQYKNLIGVSIIIGFERLSVKTDDIKVVNILSNCRTSFDIAEIDYSNYDLKIKFPSRELKTMITAVKDKSAKCRFETSKTDNSQDIVVLTLYENEIIDRTITINNDLISIDLQNDAIINTCISCNDIRGMTIHSVANDIYLYFSADKANPIIAEYKMKNTNIRLYISSTLF